MDGQVVHVELPSTRRARARSSKSLKSHESNVPRWKACSGGLVGRRGFAVSAFRDLAFGIRDGSVQAFEAMVDRAEHLGAIRTDLLEQLHLELHRPVGNKLVPRPLDLGHELGKLILQA